MVFSRILFLLPLVAGACASADTAPAVAPEAQAATAPQPPSQEVLDFRDCVRTRAEAATFNEDTKAGLRASTAAIKGQSAQAEAERLKRRFDSCDVSKLLDVCQGFALDDHDEEAVDAAFERCQNGGDEDVAEGGEASAAATVDETPKLHLYAQPGFNEAKKAHEMEPFIRLARSCATLSRPAACDATGRLSDFSGVLSSFRLEAGYTAVFYDQADFKGKALEVGKDTPHEVSELRSKDFDNVAKSVKIFGPNGEELK